MLARLSPTLWGHSILRRMNGIITSETMQKLNRRSDEDHVEPYTVAKDFLKENNYFENKGKEAA